MYVARIQPNNVITPIIKNAKSKPGTTAAKLGAVGLTPWALAEMMREPNTEVIKKYAGETSASSCEDSSQAHWYEAPGFDVC